VLTVLKTNRWVILFDGLRHGDMPFSKRGIVRDRDSKEKKRYREREQDENSFV
jgi:hypothetical protein